MQIIEITEPKQTDFQQKLQIAVGIDFGTTNSLIAIATNRKVKIIKSIGDKELIPTTIDFINEDLIIGNNKGLHSIKRLFGKTLKEILNTTTLFSLVKDYLDINSSELKLNFANKKMRIAEIAAEVFIYLKNQAEKQLKNNITKAVITVPAHFNDAARGEIMLAAKIAGFEVLRLIAEPTAAAYAYGLNKNQTGRYLVYDLGGGTFDVSILNIQEGIFQVIATNGDNMLGGDDIDVVITQYLCNKFDLPHSIETLQLAKKAKEILTYKESFNNDIISINKQTLEQLISPLVERTINITQECLEQSGNPNIDGVILVGGTTRIPLIKDELYKAFKIDILSDIDPDKAVVCGAALQAENLITQHTNSLLIDVVPLSLGIELYGGIVEKIITRNTPIPIAVIKEFTTYADNQTGIQFHILQGEREMAADCRSLARFELKGLPPMKAGNIRVEVTFAIDADGILSVSAYEKISNISHNIEIKPNHGINKTEIETMLKNAYKNAKIDYTTRLLQEAVIETEALMSSIERSIIKLTKLLSESEISIINALLDNIKDAVQTRDQILIKNSIKEFKSKIKKYLDTKLNINDLRKCKNSNQIK
ncbi:Fe-S protein assembly chaperone HscA [Rickettsia prowazekii]|uniref:Chaperone protein HscA homolog n=1 Tax=Rickettsia prowazekii (strain Madrid E) TaxID=272947 RepID=HSCA_RICPR|nr:Fe-S protein assembly chaperone HscA [Rickettsia prowazekii]Q9ZDW5.1 RecName: Full=Chaperone protein HscA homolog [Rickettsia prowazekii str. Madrid E]AFE49868.1 chaperone protein HscA [Rickettsia prowazekii str. Katsinyian]AFE50712.1 chaperone protein HscA [Rickettsia prowazekii str. BuV67-CWPP]AGJ02175.1 Chaperone protein HscA [Rickettsia prowazekii str. NMRC Madrid E]CAA14665.1 HEAT SHOCK PROTEIN HSCA (hscA) [Rickettsia prowazekii str. Madrid E]